MKLNKLYFLAFLFGGFLFSCSSDSDDFGPESIETPSTDEPNLIVERFVYRGMNDIYLYKADVRELADNFFPSEVERDAFLAGFNGPKDLFDNGLTASHDQFSWIVDDYNELRNRFSGISTTTGMNYGLSFFPDDRSKVFGFVRYVLPNTSASEQGVVRGIIFTRINGEQLTPSNFSSLLGLDGFEIGLGKLENGAISDINQSISLTKREYSANPVFISKTLELDGSKVGYLMYNSFTADFDSQLNQAFADLKGQGVTALVLDLRYNGGGNVETAVDLASMITGQFEGKIFAKERWNEKYQTYFEDRAPERLINKFNNVIRTGEAINSLNLNKLYVIATRSSASASELVINGLNAYIDVIHIGKTTRGKFQGSVTLYDSPDFGFQNKDTRHTYAMQPLVLTLVNANGVGDFTEGLDPDVEINEYLSQFKPLGDPSEPLLAAALDAIQGNRRFYSNDQPFFVPLSESGAQDMDYQKMYIDKLPGLIEE